MRLAALPESLHARLTDVRADARKRRLLLVGGIVAGLGLGWIHWTGLVVGGGLVGVSRRSVPRALLAGLAFGLFATAATVLLVPVLGPGEFVGLRRVAAVTAVVGLAAPTWGALLRAAF